MAKQVDLDQLFNRDFDSFQAETSTEFDAAMENKVKQMQRVRYFKWFLGLVLVSAALLTTLFVLNSDGNAESTLHHSSPLTLSTIINESVIADEIRNKDHKELQSIQEKTVDSEAEIPIQQTPPKKHKENRVEEILVNEEAVSDAEESSVESVEILVFERLDSKLYANEIQYLPMKPNIFKELSNDLPSIIIKPEKPKPEKKQKKQKQPKKSKEAKQKKKPKKEEVLIAESSLETENSISERESRKQKRSNEKSQNKDSAALVPKAQKVKKKRKPSSFTARVELGFSPIFFKNMAVPYEPNKDTVTFFITNKKPKISYDYGVEFLFKQVDSDWSFKTGLHYQKLSEEIDYYFQKDRMDEELSHWQYDSIFEYHIDPPIHDTVLVGIDSSYYEHWISDVSQKKHVNQYSYLNIPLLIGYQIEFPDSRFHVNVLAGANLSILLQNQGYYYNEFGYILPYEKKQKAVFNWALSAQMSIYYQWKKMGIYAKPKLQFQMNEKQLESYFERRQYLTYGIEFGVYFKIF